ncbi:fungal hydrophobin-domain-containing protein [Dichomitus squalens]|uniref:Hydrophobin n=1 Tax=Dichomitus squalens TaxID=114155 RepID=A0A4Q9PA90_9APHY|nr:fungal hydrophobin-domain-containing protein [Dichomitus squalens]TBU51358.1 fungal hydrophobin-domain-containing protein [Dichomitus squalens]
MFSRLAVVSTLAFALLAAAGNCNTGPIQCCNSLENTDTAAASTLLDLLGVAVQGVTGQLGLGCSPISVVGAGSGSACTSQPVCCQNNNVGGLVSIGCLPVEL